MPGLQSRSEGGRKKTLWDLQAVNAAMILSRRLLDYTALV